MAPIFTLAATQLLLNASVNASFTPGLHQWNSTSQPGQSFLQQQQRQQQDEPAAGKRVSPILLARKRASSAAAKWAAAEVAEAEVPAAQAAGAEEAAESGAEFDVEQRLERLDDEDKADKTRIALAAVSTQDLQRCGVSLKAFQKLTATLKMKSAQTFELIDRDGDGDIEGREVKSVQYSTAGRQRLFSQPSVGVMAPMSTIHTVMASQVTMVDAKTAQLLFTLKDYIAESAFYGVFLHESSRKTAMLQLGAVTTWSQQERENKLALLSECQKAALFAAVASTRLLLAILGIQTGDNGEDTLIDILSDNPGDILEKAIDYAGKVDDAETVNDILKALSGFFVDLYNTGVINEAVKRMFANMGAYDIAVMTVNIAGLILTIFPADGGIVATVQVAGIALAVPALPPKFKAVQLKC